MGNIGLTELLVIGGIIILLFGGTQIPKVARSLGEGLREFKKSIKEAKELDDEVDVKEVEQTQKSKNKN